MQALLWEDQQTIANEGTVSGFLSYYTQQYQSLYISDGALFLRQADCFLGHYEDLDSAVLLDDTLGWQALSFDHPAMGIVYGAMSDGSGLCFLNYLYASDVSDWIKTVTMTIQQDKPVHSLSATIMEIDPMFFTGDTALFSPGSTLTVSVWWGNEDPISLYVWYIDSIPFSQLTNEHTVQARTSLGLWLKDLSFGECNHYYGALTDVIRAIILEGATAFRSDVVLVEANTTATTVDFQPSDHRLDALLEMLEPMDWRCEQLSDGTVIVGSSGFINQYNPNTRYQFQRDRDVFTMTTTKNADGAYARVCVHTRDFIAYEYADIPTFLGWSLPQKTFYAQAPDGMTNSSDLSALAQTISKQMQYIGITETVTGSMRPHLKPGDVAELSNGNGTYTVKGIVTEVKHTFGQNGYTTQFTTDSGGDYSEVGDNIESHTRIVGGANRVRRVTDFIRGQTKQATIQSNVTASVGLSTKADKVAGTIDHVAVIGAGGNYADSQIAITDLALAKRGACSIETNTEIIVENEIPTTLTFDQIVYDTNALYQSSTPTIVTIHQPGIYFILVTVLFENNALGDRCVQIIRNENETISTINKTGDDLLQLMTTQSLCDGDTLTVKAEQSSGTDLSITHANLSVINIMNI